MTKILTYREWKNKNISIENICQECLGSGVAHYGYYGYEYECPECNGDGHTGVTKHDYETALKKDRELLEKWVNR